MQWNSHFDWNCEQFHFVELFAGAAHTSRAWIRPQNLHHLTSYTLQMHVGTQFLSFTILEI